MKAEDKSRHIMMPLLLISLGLYYLIIIEGCFTGDDMYNSCIRGYLSERGISVWAYMREQAMAWFKDGGRIFPLAVLQYLVFYIFPSVKAYKLFLVIYTLLCVYIMGKVVFEITKEPFWEKASIFLGGLLMPLFSYGAVNPMTNFGGLVQSVIFFGLLAILLELKGLQTRKGWMIWGSAVLSGCAMLTYEIGFAIPIVLFVTGLFYINDRKKYMKMQIPNMIVAGSIGVISVITKIVYNNKGIYNGTKVRIDFKAILDTFDVQFLGAIPFANFTRATKPSFLPQNIWEMYTHIDYRTIIVCVFLTVAFITIITLYECKSVEIQKRGLLICMGAIIWIVPSILISMSEKYQMELPISQLPYIPVLMEVFGLTIVILGVISGMRYGKWIITLLAVIEIIGIVPIYRYSVVCENRATKYVYEEPRELLYDITRGGIFEEIDEKSVVCIDSRYCPGSCCVFSTADPQLETDYLIYSLDGKKKNTKKVRDKTIYAVKVYVSEEYNLAVIARVDDFIYEGNADNIESLNSGDILLYVQEKTERLETIPVVYYDDQVEEWIGRVIQIDNESKKPFLKGYIVKWTEHLYDYQRFAF